jgi:pimeloyl-ACP methyl ester carboxylesterase
VRHWRHNIPVLAESAEVFAIDLLGFGSSAKPPSQLRGEIERPGSVRYGFTLWAELVAEFVEQHVRRGYPERKVLLVGNSIGGVVALASAKLLSLLLRSTGLLLVSVQCATCLLLRRADLLAIRIG